MSGVTVRPDLRRSRLLAAASFLAVLVLGGLLNQGCADSKPSLPEQPPPAKPGLVEVTSEPSGAAVFVGKTRRVGKTPTEVEAAGDKDLELLLVSDGYRHKVVNLFVSAGSRMKYHVTLEPETGTLVVDSGVLHGAKILVDGVFAGRTPNRLEVPAGQEHLVEVRKSGFEPFREVVTVAAGDQQQVKAILPPLGKKVGPRGKLTVKTDLPAMIFLDGRPLGLAPLEQQPLPAKRYTLEARSGRPGQQRKKILPVTIKANETTEVTVELQEPE